MYKKKDLLIFFLIAVVFLILLIFLFVTRDHFSVGGSKAVIDDKNRIIFVSLPEGSSPEQEISFNFFLKNNSVYIKKLSCGSQSTQEPLEKKINSGDLLDFGSYISHSKLIIRSAASETEYDLWVTTGDLPIITIESSETIVDEPKVGCNISIISSENGFLKKNISSEIELIDVSRSVTKQSYSLNILENSITGKSPSILDFGDRRRFRLSSSFMDRSFLREKLSYDIFGRLSSSNISPESRHVELYVEGCYMGLYLISERQNRDMFSLSNYDSEDEVHSVIYEASNSRADFTKGAEGFSQVEPDMENDRSYFEPLLELADFIYKSEKDEFLANTEEVVNIENVLDNHILFLLAGAVKETASNNYIYRGNDSAAKFNFSPGRHYLFGFGIDDSSNKIDPEEIFYPSRLFNRLYQEEDYREKLKDRWNLLREGVLTVDNIYKIIDGHTGQLADAQERNFEKWPADKEIYGDSLTFSMEVSYLKDFIKKRLEFLDDYINYPPILMVGDTYVMIDEQSGTAFCSLPESSDTMQEISWYFRPDTEIHIEPFSWGEHVALDNKYTEYQDMVESSRQTDEITIFVDAPEENSVLEDRIKIFGWALNQQAKDSTGVEHILLFDGPIKSSENFLGAAGTESRKDVADYFENPAYSDAGFGLYLDTMYLENGLHEIYLYAFDGKGNYSLKVINIEIDNKNNSVSELRNVARSRIYNNDKYDFVKFIFHGKLIVADKNGEKAYDLYITTSDVGLVIIDVPGPYIPEDHKVYASIQIIHKESDEKNFINENVFDYNGPAGIEYRGKSSLGFPKKQFSIELRDENGEDKNASLLGMPSESDWILGAPYSDKTLMRNVLAFEISRQMGMYATRTEFVEVFLNIRDDQIREGDYRGVFVLTEKIKRDKDRINISQLNSDDDSLISGGYILEISSTARINPWESYIETDRGLKLINKYPRAVNITKKQKQWITDYMNEFENALYSENFRDPYSGYSRYIDVDSFIDYIIINELFKNRDIFQESTFLHKERNEKIKIGPVWDFNLSSGNRSEKPTTNGPTQWRYINILWTERLFQDEDFAEKYISRWKELMKDVLSDANIDYIIDDYASLLADAQARNFEKWEILGKYIWPNSEPYAESYEEEIDKLKLWFHQRTEWIDKNIDFLQP